MPAQDFRDRDLVDQHIHGRPDRPGLRPGMQALQGRMSPNAPASMQPPAGNQAQPAPGGPAPAGPVADPRAPAPYWQQGLDPNAAQPGAQPPEQRTTIGPQGPADQIQQSPEADQLRRDPEEDGVDNRATAGSGPERRHYSPRGAERKAYDHRGAERRDYDVRGAERKDFDHHGAERADLEPARAERRDFGHAGTGGYSLKEDGPSGGYGNRAGYAVPDYGAERGSQAQALRGTLDEYRQQPWGAPARHQARQDRALEARGGPDAQLAGTAARLGTSAALKAGGVGPAAQLAGGMIAPRLGRKAAQTAGTGPAPPSPNQRDQ